MAVRRGKRDIQTVTGTWNATTSTVLVTKTPAAQMGDACSWDPSTGSWLRRSTGENGGVTLRIDITGGLALDQA
jgi:hypothetical protein